MSEQQLTRANQLNQIVSGVLGAETVMGFDKAFMVADAIGKLKELLTPEYMKPIMELQGNKLGFRTDRDKDGGYSEKVVKNCLVEAVLTGVQPFGNQFNIISESMYLTKEGLGYLLNNIPGLEWNIIPELPRIDEVKKSSAVIMKIKWTYNGKTEENSIDFPVKLNSFMGTDAVIGKATRKARKWLYERIKGIEVGDGDVTDPDFRYGKAEQAEVVKEDPNKKTAVDLINNAKTLKDLEKNEQAILQAYPDLFAEFETRRTELSK